MERKLAHFTLLPRLSLTAARGRPQPNIVRSLEDALSRRGFMLYRFLRNRLVAVFAVMVANRSDVMTSSGDLSEAEADELFWLWCSMPEDRAFVALPAYLSLRRSRRHE